MSTSATTTPIQVYATWTPAIASLVPSQPVGEKTVASAMPETAVGRANGQVDHRIQQAPPRELVAHQRPGDDEAEHGVDRGCQCGRTE
jgi:hypothetical protein